MFASGRSRIAAAALLSLLGGCASKHVYFFPQNVAADAPSETRIFLDARGHLYPKTGLPGDMELRTGHQGSLFEAAYDAKFDLCKNTAAETEMALLCAAISRDKCTTWSACVANWEIAQQALWQRRGQEIAAAAAREGETMLVFLIHGFNNWYSESEPNFNKAELTLNSVAPAGQKLRFIEVFWDGCRASDTGVGCWGKAQATGPLVGFSLRQLFNAIEDSWPATRSPAHLRVLTHSSGAFVASATVGNPSAALPLLQDSTRNERYELFADNASAASGPYRIPQPSDLKIAMLAAATPYTSYSGSDSFPGGALVRGLDLLISIHPKDRAITKMGIINCRAFGASCLGARREDVCALQTGLEQLGKNMSVTGYDFVRDKRIWGKKAKSHDFSVYLQQASQHSSLLRDFMAITTPEPHDGTEGLPISCSQ